MRRLRSIAVSIAALCLSIPAGAQLLDLGDSSAPAPGDGALVIAQIADLDARIDNLRQAGFGADADSEERRWRLASLRLCRELLATGERVGEPGSLHIALGLAMLDSLHRPDESGGERGEPPLSLVAARGMAGASIDRLCDAGLPSDPFQLSLRLQECLGVLAQVEDPTSTVNPAPAHESIGTGWAQSSRAKIAVQSLQQQTTSPLHAVAAGAAWALAEAKSAGDVISATPQWVSPEHRESLWARYDEAVLSLVDARSRPAAVAHLRIHARLATLALAADGLEGRTAEVQGAQRAISAIIGMADRPQGLGSAAERLVSLAAARRQQFGDGRQTESRLEREARPAWRLLDREARRTEELVLGTIARLVDDHGAPATRSDPLASPDAVGAVAAHDRAMADLRGLVAFSGVLAAETDAPRRRLLGLRLLKIGQSLAREGPRDADERTLALAELRLALRLAEPQPEALAALTPLATPDADAEPAIDPEAAEWTSSLLSAAEITRRSALDAWSRSESGAQAASDHLQSLFATLRAVHTLAVLRQLESSSALAGDLNAHPCWEVSSGTLSAGASQWRALTERAVVAVLARDAAATQQALASLDAHAAVRAIAHRAEQMRSTGTRPRSASPLRQLVDTRWAADQQIALRDASLCRYLAEWAAESADAEHRNRCLEHASHLARQALPLD